MGKTMSARKKKLEQYTTGCLKTSARKLEETCQLQQDQRMKLQKEFHTRAIAIFNQWETDIEKTKENEEKLQNQLKQQQKLFQQLRLVQTQRMVAMKDLFESFCKNTDELEKAHLSQQTTSQAEMKRELTVLQKKLLMETQRQEMDSVRKSLQTLFY